MNLKKIVKKIVLIALKKKLEGVGPVDNRPSTVKLHHLVKKNIWDMWHVTRLGGVNILSKFQLPSSDFLWFMILWRSGGKGSLN